MKQGQKILSSALIFLLSFSLVGEFKPIVLKKSDKEIAKYVSRMMEVYHYSKKKLDNDLSEKMFIELFRQLDFNRRIFLNSDIEEFRSYEMLLDEMFKRGDLTFALKVYNRYIQRLQERVKFVEERIDKPFDFGVEEDFVVDRSELDWPETKDQLNDIWRQFLKNEILRMELSEIIEQEKALEEKENAEKEGTKPEEDAEENTADATEEEKEDVTPQKMIVKRYKNFLKYQEENDRENLLEMSLNVMTKCFDPHSNYFGAKAQEEFEISMKLSLIGIGATLTVDDGYTKVMSLVPGGPAATGKELKVGDRIIAVGQGEKPKIDAIDMRLSKVVSMIRGKKGTVVTLHVVRGGVNGSAHVIKIKRDEIKLKESEAKGEIKELKLDDQKIHKVGVIHLPSFYADWDAIREGKEGKSSTADVRKILKDQVSKGIDSLIIDLRSNGGGSLPEAIALTGLFVDKGPVVQIREASGRIFVRNDEDAGTIYDGPLVVLVNEGSASASEIFAAAIQDYKRGVVVGTYRTHGKGTVQQVQSLERLRAFADRKDLKPGQVKYTMAKFYRINGGSTQKKGVVPDIILPSYAEFDDHGEATLRNVLKWDEIRNLNVDENVIIKGILPQIKKQSDERLKASNDFNDLVKDIEYYKERRERKSVTLNKQKRLTLFEEDNKVRKEREKLFERLFDRGDKEDGKDDNGIKDDIYLKEALRIVADLNQLQKEQASK
ncbi:MAG: carboxy terminal-processing peptidase [Lentisphaeraceae bacterium]|nr:carboxy terminal-processing peptidase [Lentisphaeraceae bacterium]